MRRIVEYAFYRLFAGLVPLLPRRGVVWLARRLGMAYFVCDTRGRRTGLENLARALPDLQDPKRVLIRSYRLQAVAMLDALYSRRLTSENAKRFVEIPEEVRERFQKLLGRGKGAVVASAHYGSWEMFNLAGGTLGMPRATVIARPVRNKWIDRHLVRARERTGNRVVYRDEAIAACMHALRRKEIVASVIDMSVVPSEGGLFVDFFGTPALTSGALALLAILTKAPLVFVVCRPLDRGDHYRLEMQEIEVDRSGDRDANVLNTTASLNAALEKKIRAHPEPWIWNYKRWKSRPGEQPGPYPSYCLWVHPHW